MENNKENIKILEAMIERNEKIYENLREALQNAEIYLSIFKENTTEIKEYSKCISCFKRESEEEIKWMKKLKII